MDRNRRARILTEDTFEAAKRVSRDNSQWSPRRVEPGQWLLRGLVKCGVCRVGANCHKMRGRNGTWHRYYYCRNHDPIKAGGSDRRCTERNIRSDTLDAFVFDQVRTALLRPEVLTAGEQALAVRAPAADDELLGAELTRLDRKLDGANAERRRLQDLYQAGFVELPDLQRRATEVEHRRRELEQRRDDLAAQRHDLTRDNQLRRRVGHFAHRVLAVIDALDFDQRQTLLRLIVEEVHVTGCHVQIRLRIPLDDDPNDRPQPPGPPLDPDKPRPVSTQDSLRSLGSHHRRHEPPRPNDRIADPGRVSGAERQRPDPEVPERARRRTFTARYKLEVLAAYDAAADGEKGALLRREGLYSSHIVDWRRARDAGALAGLAQPRGRPRCDPQAERIARLEADKRQLEQELAKARFVVDVQAKLHALLETISESAEPANGSST
ncbi:MAG: recombinase zinc beta ribbon domain-containing protein [Mycobacteriales bacterium]